MAKSPKKNPAKKAVAKKPAAKAKKPAAAKKSTAAKKPAKAAAPKKASKPKAAKKPATKVAAKATKPKPATKPSKASSMVAFGQMDSNGGGTSPQNTGSTGAGGPGGPPLPPPPPGGGGGGVAAAPQITSPAAGAVTAGVNLPISATTARGDLRFVIEWRDVSPPPILVLPPPIQINVAAPGANPITGTVGGANVVAGHTYRIRVFVDPIEGGTPLPDSDAINVTA